MANRILSALNTSHRRYMESLKHKERSQLTQKEMGECYHVEQASIGQALHIYPAGGKAAL